VLGGTPDAWIDGMLHRLEPGDAVTLPDGSGIAYCLMNDTEAAVRLLIVGENNPQDRVVYPVDPQRQNRKPWTDAPVRKLGPHDGRPKQRLSRASLHFSRVWSDRRPMRRI
jgi:uncharacterized cupin superfamily protein